MFKQDTHVRFWTNLPRVSEGGHSLTLCRTEHSHMMSNCERLGLHFSMCPGGEAGWKQAATEGHPANQKHFCVWDSSPLPPGPDPGLSAETSCHLKNAFERSDAIYI